MSCSSCDADHCLAGDQAQQYVIEFDEKSGPDPLGDMLMKVNRQAMLCR